MLMMVTLAASQRCASGHDQPIGTCPQEVRSSAYSGRMSGLGGISVVLGQGLKGRA